MIFVLESNSDQGTKSGGATRRGTAGDLIALARGALPGRAKVTQRDKQGHVMALVS